MARQLLAYPVTDGDRPFSDWKVVDDFREGYEQRPCAAPAIHYDTLEILLVNDTWS